MSNTKKHQRGPEIESIWASVLRAAAVVTREAATGEADVIRSITKELSQLKIRSSISLLTLEGQLEVHTPAFGRSVENALKRMSGLEIIGYRFDPQKVSIYQEALSTREAIFTDNHAEIISQLLPRLLRPLPKYVTRLLGRNPVIIAPLISADRPMGTINVSAPWLTPDDIPMVAALADHIAIALKHVQTQVEMQAALKRERLRNQVAEALASALDLPVVLERVIRLTSEATGADAGAIALIDSSGETVIYPYLYNLPEELRLQPTPRGQGLAWHLIESRTLTHLPEYGQHPQALPSWIEAGVHSFLGVPLVVGDEAIGAMGLFSLTKEHSFDQEQVEIAQAIASMAAIAVKNARLYSDATQRAEESQTLIRTARSISASLDHETVLQLIAEQAKVLFQADGSRIHLIDPDQGTLHCLVALDPNAEAIMSVELETGQGVTGYVAELGLPILANDPSSDPRGMHVPGTLEDELECLALAPLKVRQRTMGVMTVRRLGLDRPFTSSDLDLLTAFAAQAAVALENAHLYGLIADQAQRLKTEVADRTRDLALSEAHYRALVETTLAGIIRIDIEGVITYVNQAFANLAQIPPEEMIGQSFTSFNALSPEIIQEMFERFQDRMRGERPAREVYEMELINQSGQHIPALIAASLITDDKGFPQGIMALVLDISKRKTLEAALQAERDRLDALLNNIGDAVMVTDPEGLIEFVNPGWERLNGYSAAEALGKTPRLIISDQHTPEFYAEMWETITSGKTWRGEVVNRRKDDSLYDAALTITPVLNDAGQVISFVGVQHDISALKELDRIKSQFVSDVSHELRTPLTNIRLYLDLLGKTIDDPARTARYLVTLSRESERLANLIDDLLSLSRLDADALPFEPAPVDINQLLNRLVEDRRNLAARRGLELTFDADTSLPQIIGDERLLSQVFTNLLTNAMHYTPDSGRITLRTYKHTISTCDWLVAEVEDTGLGIPPDEMRMIFRRFFRGHASQATTAAGTGLGLAICKEILDRHNGRITVESDGIPGHGSRFLVWLPLPNKE